MGYLNLLFISVTTFLKFLTVLPRDLFRNPIKSLWWSVFAKIVKDFQPFTIFAKKLRQDIRLGSKLALGDMSEDQLELS